MAIERKGNSPAGTANSEMPNKTEMTSKAEMTDSCVDWTGVEECDYLPRRSSRKVKERRLTLIDEKMAGLAAPKKTEVKREGNSEQKQGHRIEGKGSEKEPEKGQKTLNRRTDTERPAKILKAPETDMGVSEDPFTGRRVGRQFEGVMRGCRALLTQIMIHKWAHPFKTPVDPIALGLPDYHDVITRPMDLATIRARMEAGEYGSDYRSFASDMRLIFDNAMRYNRDGSDIYIMAESVRAQFNFKMAKLLESLKLPPEDGFDGGEVLPKPARNVSRVPKVGNSGPKIVGKAPRSRPGLEYKPGRGAYSVATDPPEEGKKRPGGKKRGGHAQKRRKGVNGRRLRGGRKEEVESESESEVETGETTEESESECEVDEKSECESEEEIKTPARVRPKLDPYKIGLFGEPLEKRFPPSKLTFGAPSRNSSRVWNRWQRNQLAAEIANLPLEAQPGLLKVVVEYDPKARQDQEEGREVEVKIMYYSDECVGRMADYVSNYQLKSCPENQELFVKWAKSDDSLELPSESDSDTCRGIRINSDIVIDGNWENFDESFDNHGASARALQPLQAHAAARPPPLQILDPKTLQMTGPKSPFLGHKHSQEIEAWVEYDLQSPSEMGDGEICDRETSGEEADPNAGMEYLSLDQNESRDIVAQ